MINSATSLGWESIGTWLVGRVRVFAFILLAVLISCSGAIIRSLEEMTNQLGLVCHAALVMGVERLAPCVATLGGEYHTFFVRG